MRKHQRPPSDVRSEFRYIARRLWLLDQHPDKHAQEIQCLEQARYAILFEWPHIVAEFRQEDLIGTANEL